MSSAPTPRVSGGPPPTAEGEALSLQCRSCGAALLVGPDERTTRCPYCASASVVERPPTRDRPAPAFGFGFGLGAQAARDAVAAWLRARGPFTRSGVRRAKVEDVRGVYLPAYLYSALARSEWRARIGEHYWETETYTSQGRTRTRRVRRTEWHPLQGRHEEYVPDILVSASRGLPNRELEAIEPFDLRLMHRYVPHLVSGWLAEEPSRTRAECLALARTEANARIRERLEAFMPGDTHQGLEHSVRFEHEAADLCLVPVYVLSARYHPEAPPFRVLVNGQTGRTWGQAPLSWVKVGLAAAAGLALLAAWAWLLGGGG